MAEKTTAKTKIKKKKWVPILAPSIFHNIVLGETYVTENEEVKVKSVTQNLMMVTNDMRKQAYAARFDVTDVKDGKASSMLIGLEMTPSAIKRLIRRGRNKIEDSFTAVLKTGQTVRVKPVVVTNTRCSNATQTEIRLAARTRLVEILKTSTLDGFVREVLDGRIQRILRDDANKTHPIRSVDIRVVTLLPQNKGDLTATREEIERELHEKSVQETEARAKRKAAREAEKAAPQEVEEASEEQEE